MTTRMGAALAAGVLAVGILVGAAGTVLVGEATGSTWRANAAGSMPMMGGGSMMSGPMMSGIDVDEMAALHAQHHGLDR